jgi:glycerol-3-phosphate dehydrogenase
MVAGGRVAGIRAHGKDEATTEIHAPVVILCVGPRARSLARRFDRDHAELSSAVLAFNMLLDVPVPGASALAISPTPGRGRSLFFRGHDGLLLAGTWYAPWFDAVEPEVSPQLIENALADVRACMPGVECTRAVVRDIWVGVLPGESTAGSLRSRDVFLNHGVRGGAHGLYSVQGVKLTTARALSARAASQIWPFQSRESQHGRRMQHRRST